MIALPSWLARIVQRPAAMIVTVVPLTVHPAVVEVNVTVSRELDDAETVNGASPYVLPLRGSNVIVWAILARVTVVWAEETAL